MNYHYKGAGYNYFMGVFKLADRKSITAIADTYSEESERCGEDVEYFTSLTVALNHQLWNQYNKGDEYMAKVYNDLLELAKEYGYSHFKGDELIYFRNVMVD